MLLLTAIILCNLQSIMAQKLTKMETIQNDKTAITKVIEDFYFKGLYNGNVDILKQSFNHETLVYGDVKGKPYAKTLEQYLDGVKNRQSPKDSGKPFKGEIISIKNVNSIAIAEVKVVMYDFVYYDLLSFHRIDNKWLIVNKMLTDINP